MAAGVHDAFDLTGIGHARLLDDGQRIHVGTYQELGAPSVLQNRHHAVGLRAVRILAHPLRDRVAALAQLRRQQRRGLFLMMRQLGVSMDAFVGVDQTDILRHGRRGQQGRKEHERRDFVHIQ